jgi:hypothetical protein
VKNAMSTAHCLRFLLVLGAAGCASNPHIMTPRIAPVLAEAGLDLPVEDCRASATWVPSYGHGLTVEIWATRFPEDYRRDLDLELSGAAEVCAALGPSEVVLEWDFLEVVFTNRYGRMPPRSREVSGVARVIIRRETLLTLRASAATASVFPRHWEFINGFKDQPDSKEVLKW